MTSQLSRQQDAWGKVQSAGENALDLLIDGDFNGALKEVEKTLLDLAVKAPLKNALFGTDNATLDDLGGLSGLIAKLFGGANDNGAGAVSAAVGSAGGSLAVDPLVAGGDKCTGVSIRMPATPGASAVARSGGVVVRVNWGAPCFKKEYQTRFYNLRACAMVRFRDAVKQGRVSVTADLDLRVKEKILLQASRLPYHFSEAGGLRYVMESKEEMRKNGIKSPDMIDAMSFAFLEGTTYIPAVIGGDDGSTARGKAVNALEEALAAAGV